jgi:hypothetical protein
MDGLRGAGPLVSVRLEVVCDTPPAGAATPPAASSSPAGAEDKAGPPARRPSAGPAPPCHRRRIRSKLREAVCCGVAEALRFQLGRAALPARSRAPAARARTPCRQACISAAAGMRAEGELGAQRASRCRPPAGALGSGRASSARDGARWGQGMEQHTQGAARGLPRRQAAAGAGPERSRRAAQGGARPRAARSAAPPGSRTGLRAQAARRAEARAPGAAAWPPARWRPARARALGAGVRRGERAGLRGRVRRLCEGPSMSGAAPRLCMRWSEGGRARTRYR